MKHVVAVDVGYGFVKVTSTNGSKAIFPSYIGESIVRKDLGIGKLMKDDKDNIEVKINGNGYFVGELSRKVLENAPVFEKDRRNERTLNLIATAIQLVNPLNESIYLVTGLPLEQYADDKTGFKQYLDGREFDVEWVTGTHKGKTIFSKIEDSLICPQGAAAIMTSLMNEDGTLKYPDMMFEGSRIALIDIGFKTTDVIVVEVGSNSRNLTPVLNMSFTIDEVGMSKVHTRLKKEFKDNYKQDMTSHMLHQALKGIPFTVKGKKIELTKELDKIKATFAEKIVVELQEEWRENESNLTSIFLAGGGALDLESNLFDKFTTKTITIKDSQYANANGYLRAGKPYFARLEREKTNIS